MSALSAKAGNKLVRLSWENPSAADFDHVEITRSGTAPGSSGKLVYHGSGTTFPDRSVLNGIEYRYVVVSFDGTGNASRGLAIAATPKRPLLLSPLDGAKLKKAPTLDWVDTATARYYNVQLFHGPEKILSIWPLKSTLVLKGAWTWGGKRRRLTDGTYRWFVWPGVGPRNDAKYGPLLGSSTFKMVG